MNSLTTRIAKLEAADTSRSRRSFTFSGGTPETDLDAYAASFGVMLSDSDDILHVSVRGLDEPIRLTHCSDMGVWLAYVAKFGNPLVPQDEDDPEEGADALKTIRKNS